ncbi:MAG: hypothetical protein ACHQIO_17135 [Nevskiales bacterium]
MLWSMLPGAPAGLVVPCYGRSVAAAFGGLRAGQVVMLGSVTPPIWLGGACTVTVSFRDLPEVRVQLR